MQTQNRMLITLKTSKRKPEIEFQYGGDLFSKTGNRYMSAADLATLSKFSMQIDFDVLTRDTSSKRKPEVDLRRCGRKLGNGYGVITRLPMVRFG